MGRPTSITRGVGDIMDRRELLGVLGAGAAGLAGLGGGEARAGHEGPHDDPIKTLGECAKVCYEAAQHCLEQLRKEPQHAEHHANAHEAAMDCQAFCVLTATLVARSSPYAKYAHGACADACRDCAAACEGHQDAIMKQCVKACRECEKVCRSMSSGT